MRARSASAPADLVIYGRVWTGDSARPWAEAVAIAGNKIQAVGDSSAVAKRVDAHTRVLANGRDLITPGLMDDHVHLLSGGFQIARVKLRDASSPADFIQRIKGQVGKTPLDEWITGGDWDHTRWPGAPLPDRRWIDSVSPKTPVYVTRAIWSSG